MKNDHNDDPMDELLVQAARDYNAPLTVPREEMWSRIQDARTAQKSRRTSHVWVWPGVGIAAAALLTAGVLIGRNWERTRDTAHQAVARTSSPEAAGSKASRTGESIDASASLSYRLVVLKHLAGSEAMITAFRSSAKRGEVDAQIADWSKELLSTTRMLEASASSDDPTMRRLLEDLDLVLAQIKQYVTRGTNSPDDLDLIEQSINKRGVMTKLRSTLPNRTSPVGT
jgi:hypothetical protein